MALFNNDTSKERPHSGILGAFSVDVIKWEPESSQESNIIAHKFEYEDFPSGSYLIVAPSQIAVFMNHMGAGSSLDTEPQGASQVAAFIGPCKIKLETGDNRFAPFRSVAHALTGGDSAFHSVVYFISTTYINELSWGTQERILLQDPEEEVNVHVGAQGYFSVHLEHTNSFEAQVNVRKFLQRVVGTQSSYTREQLEKHMRTRILEYVPDLLAKSIIEKGIGVLRINAKLSEFSSYCSPN